MPKMSIRKKAILITKSDDWTAPYPREPKTREDKIKQFCHARCPHPEQPCNGDCPEIRAYTKQMRKRRVERA